MPTPPLAATTAQRARAAPLAAGSPARELRQELLTLPGAEAADTPVRSDSHALHHCAGSGRADSGQRAEHLIDLRLPGEVIIATEHIGESEAGRP
jgi:hypothetical protein